MERNGAIPDALFWDQSEDRTTHEDRWVEAVVKTLLTGVKEKSKKPGSLRKKGRDLFFLFFQTFFTNSVELRVVETNFSSGYLLNLAVNLVVVREI